jgi:electron transfer flavoprotein alpha subunit
MAEQREIWVFSEKPTLGAELIGCARGLTQGAVVALVAGPRGDAETAVARGADKVFWLGEAGSRMVEDYVPTIAKLAAEQKPFAILIGATKRGKAVAGRLAARLETSAITDVKAFDWADGALHARHLIFGGGAVRVEQARSSVVIATLGMGVAEPLPADPSHNGAVVDVPFVEPGWKVTVSGHKPKGTSTVNLASAKRVVCPGRGLAKQEDLAMVEDLARTLEAEIGCTRPLAEGLDWLPRERYIGVSGAFIKADLYLAIGVSGQVQHTVGVTDSRVIVAINKDKNAPIFEQADYGIEGDLYAVVPALIKALKERK